ncbi:MAG: hypothetical protein M3Y68_02020, partial [Chloroflexota bacterium]|nr:hypothetical protein [Chloroflexota bacterium]
FYYYAKEYITYHNKYKTQVLALIDESSSLGYEQEDPFEWLTYIESLAQMGDIQAAEERARSAFNQDNGIRRGLCEIWKRVQPQSSAVDDMETRRNEILVEFQCT